MTEVSAAVKQKTVPASSMTHSEPAQRDAIPGYRLHNDTAIYVSVVRDIMTAPLDQIVLAPGATSSESPYMGTVYILGIGSGYQQTELLKWNSDGSVTFFYQFSWTAPMDQTTNISHFINS